MGRNRQGSHLDLGQNSNYGDADTKSEVEANENLALIAGTGLGVVDKQQRHSRDRQRVEEEGEEEEAWEGGAAAGGSGCIRTPSLIGQSSGLGPQLPPPRSVCQTSVHTQPL